MKRQLLQSKLLRICIAVSSCALFVILGADTAVKEATQGCLYNAVETVPYRKVGLLLGTSKRLGNGKLNQYYENRIRAAVKLFKAKKIEYILVSGDKSPNGYDEPTAMKEDLITAGIPEDRLILDYAGFRTLDSVVRAKELYGQKSLTIVSQQFHNERAIYLVQKNGMEAMGFNAKKVDAFWGIKTKLREKLARVKMFLDLWQGTGPTIDETNKKEF